MFENTLGDLSDCVDRMGNVETLAELTEDMSEYERRAFDAMWRVCRDFLAEHERLLNTAVDQEDGVEV
jgi:hypothetical protein